MTSMKELGRYLGMEVPKQFDFDLTKFAHSANESARVMRSFSKHETEMLIITFKAMRKLLRKKMKHNSAFRTVSNRKWAGHKNNKPKYNWSKKRRRQGGWRA